MIEAIAITEFISTDRAVADPCTKGLARCAEYRERLCRTDMGGALSELSADRCVYCSANSQEG